MHDVVKEIFLQNVTPPHAKFYRIRCVQRDDGKFLLIREYGRIGSYIKTKQEEYLDYFQLMFDVASHLRKRRRNGYAITSIGVQQ